MCSRTYTAQTDSWIEEVVEPEEAFSVLAEETRIAILQALWEADEYEATFTGLRKAVGHPF